VQSAIQEISHASGKVCQRSALDREASLAKHQNQHSDGNRDTHHGGGIVGRERKTRRDRPGEAAIRFGVPELSA
jgi:hypothetical protein